jgi:hypothetical protein
METVRVVSSVYKSEILEEEGKVEVSCLTDFYQIKKK